MDEQVGRALGQALREAIARDKQKHYQFAKRMGITSPQLSKYINGRQAWTLDLAKKFDQQLGGTEMADAFVRLTQRIDIYISSPITGLADESIPIAHEQTGTLVDFLRNEGYSVQWPGERIPTIDKLIDPTVATTDNIRDIVRARAVVYVQFNEVIHPSGALIELGIALGRKMRTTVLALEGLQLPFMLRNGFDGVAGASPDLPDARIRQFRSMDDAVRQIRNTGPAFFGLN